ncbi:hypothetical protein Aperf_G00000016382 [Anoplocephala perfoliata]
MDGGEFDAIFTNNLKALGADFKFLKLPIASAAVRILALVKAFQECGVYLAPRPAASFLPFCLPMYWKNALSEVFSSTHSGNFVDFSDSNAEFLDDVESNIREYLENVSQIRTKSPLMEKLSSEHHSILSEEDLSIQRSCLEYAKLGSCNTNAIQDLATYQSKCWNDLQGLRERFSSLYSEWLLMKPLYSDFASLCEDPSFVTAKDFNKPANENRVPTLSDLMKNTSEVFLSLQKSLARYDDLENEVSSELMWCFNSLSRLTESGEFEDQKKLSIDTRVISSRLDTVISKLNEMITEYADALSPSLSLCSSRHSGLQISNSFADSKGRPSTGDHSSDSSLRSRSPSSSSRRLRDSAERKTNVDINRSPSINSFSGGACVNPEAELKPETQFKCDRMPPKSILKMSSLGLSPENCGFDDDDDSLFNNINNELASLLQTTTLADNSADNSCRNDENEDFENQEEINLPSQAGTPKIQPPLVPSRILNTRMSLKSLRFGSPISSERMIGKGDDFSNENQDGPVVSEPPGVLYTSPALKSFSEFVCDSSKSVCLIFLDDMNDPASDFLLSP